MKIIIDPNQESADLYQDMDVDLIKKPGKGLGLSVVGRRDGNGVFISDMVIFRLNYDASHCYFTRLNVRKMDPLSFAFESF